MSQSVEQLEALLAQSAPTLKAGDGLRLRIVREARKQAWQRMARRQLTLAVMVCALLFGVTEFHFRTVSHATSMALRVERAPAETSFVLGRIDLPGKSIGEWGHVEAVLAQRTRLAEAVHF